MLRRVLRFVAAALLIPVGLYVAAAGILSHVPVNANWREPVRGITIFVQSNGVHTGIVMPAAAAGIDWPERIRASDLPDPRGAGAWLVFGWGDRRFYLETPTWRKVGLSTVFRALAGGGPTVMHVDHLNAFLPDENWRPLRLRPEEYRRLAAFVAASFADDRRATPGYTPRDVFYPARGEYSALRTCNVWTAEALRAAGVRTGLWTPLAGSVMAWVPLPEKARQLSFTPGKERPHRRFFSGAVDKVR